MKIKIHETVKDGRCLFHSAAIILRHLNNKINIDNLKNAVIEELLKKNDLLKLWHTFYIKAVENNDKIFQEHYAFMKPFLHKNPPISIYDKIILRKEFRRNCFWGEENSIQILENLFNIEFMIFNNSQNRFEQSLFKNKQKKYMGFLWFSGNHYKAISIDNQFLFKKNN